MSWKIDTKIIDYWMEDINNSYKDTEISIRCLLKEWTQIKKLSIKERNKRLKYYKKKKKV